MQLLKKGTTSEESTYYRSRTRFYALILFGIIIIIGIICVALINGNYYTSIYQVFATLLKPETDPQIYAIIIYSRLPRLIAALVVGAALSSAGWVYQEVFTNRMVSPDILGVSSGAGVGASIGIIMGYSLGKTSVIAFCMGLISVGLTMVISKIFSNNTDKTLSTILSGIVISGLMSSLLGFLKYISNDAQLATITYWLLGGFYNVTYKELIIAVPVIIICLICLTLFRWKIMMLKYGEIDARIHGINYSSTRIVAIVLSTIVTAISVSISGTIGWIGLAIPNLIRIMVNDDEKCVLPLAMLYGAAFTGLSDFFARSITGTEIPIGIITGILGAVIFVFAIAFRRYRNG